LKRFECAWFLSEVDNVVKVPDAETRFRNFESYWEGTAVTGMIQGTQDTPRSITLCGAPSNAQLTLLLPPEEW
jgi:hypothetical protein